MVECGSFTVLWLWFVLSGYIVDAGCLCLIWFVILVVDRDFQEFSQFGLQRAVEEVRALLFDS